MDKIKRLFKREKSINSTKAKPQIKPFSFGFILPVLAFTFCVLTTLCYPENVTEIFFGAGICTVEASPVAAYPLPTAPPYIIAIDMGHGGMDTGAQSIIDETQLIETTAAYLYDLLEKDENFTPVLTRQVGQDPTSVQRAQVATENRAAALISIHGNYDSSSRRTHGFECFPTPPGREYSEKSMDLAACIASQMKQAGHTLRGENHCGIRYAYYSGSSKRMVEISDAKVRSQKSFGIVEKPSCPAVLVEQAFITNYDDVDNWGKDEGCKKAAKVYYLAFCQYFSTTPMEDKVNAAQP